LDRYVVVVNVTHAGFPLLWPFMVHHEDSSVFVIRNAE